MNEEYNNTSYTQEEQYSNAAYTQEEVETAKTAKPRKKKKTLKELLTAKSIGGLILRIVILLAIPYAFLMLCGLIFDKWLKMYYMTTPIFIALCILYVIAIILCICCIVWFNKAKKSRR